MFSYSSQYNERIKDEEGKSVDEVLIASVGKIDPKRHLVTLRHYLLPKVNSLQYQGNSVEELMSHNILQVLGTMLGAVVF